MTELNRRVRNDGIATQQSLVVVTAVVLSVLLFLDFPMFDQSLSLSENWIADATSSTRLTNSGPFTIGINQTAHLESIDLNLRFVNVTEDSRCPSDVQCIWAGQVSILVDLQIAFSEETLGRFEMTLPGNSESGMGNNDHLSIGGYLVELVDVTPYSSSTTVIGPSDYGAILIVSKAQESLIPSNPAAVDALGMILNDVKTGETIMLTTEIYAYYGDFQ